MSKSCLKCGKDISDKRRVVTKYCSKRCNNLVHNSDAVSRMHIRVKSRAKKSGIPFSISREDIIIPARCPVLGIEIITHTGSKGYRYNSASLDRIIPELGYVPGNIQVISAKANLMKNDATSEELLAFGQWIEETYG